VAETSPPMSDRLKQQMLTTSLKALVECNRIGTSTDFRAELPTIDVPTLVIHGDRDASAPHGLFVTHMERLNHDLYEFIIG
jgi:pimeloyl-ACP methyl ester carboxylesterase